MPSETRELRVQARKLGASNVAEMSRSELKEFIAEHSNGSNGKRSRKAAAKAVKAKVKRGPGRPRKVVDEDDEDEVQPKRRGRPKGSKNKTKTTSGAKRGRPAKTEARVARKKSAGPGRPAGSGPGTRVLLSESIDWDRDFDFREGSIQHYILNQIRKVAQKYEDTSDIRAEVFDRLVDKIGSREELTFQNRETGRPHKGEKAEGRLKYYISRTMFDYAVNTGQHESAGDSVKLRAGADVSTKKTGGKKRGRPRKVVDDEDEDEAPRKRRGRPPGSKNKPKRGPGRPRKDEEAPKRRGRPPGSKNKVKRGPGRPKGSKNRR